MFKNLAVSFFIEWENLKVMFFHSNSIDSMQITAGHSLTECVYYFFYS